MPVKCLDGEYDRFHGTVTIAVPLAVVRACFEGPMLARCRAVSLLPTVHQVRLFPDRKRRHCANMLRIARRLRLKEHDGTHTDCRHCGVIRVLDGAAFDLLACVAKFDDPDEQLRVAASTTLLG